MHQVQFGITQMFDSIRRFLGRTYRFEFSVAALTESDVDAVAVGNSSSGSGTVSYGSNERFGITLKAFADGAPVSTRFQLRFGEIRQMQRCRGRDGSSL
jgi:hypothetical protein